MSTTPSEHFLELFDAKLGEYLPIKVAAQEAARQFFAENAVIPRDQMPVLDEHGFPSGEWWEEADKTAGEDRLRRFAAYDLARAEWYEEKEAKETDPKAAAALTEHRNAVSLRVFGREYASLGLVSLCHVVNKIIAAEKNIAEMEAEAKK